jgi:uncharacterized membrane protein YgcG
MILICSGLATFNNLPAIYCSESLSFYCNFNSGCGKSTQLHPKTFKPITMKAQLLLAATVVFLASCSTAYRTGQTPDDVYYSPARETAGYVQVDNDREERYDPRRNQQDEYYYEDADDRYLRMRVRNRYRWSAFDDYYMNDWRYNTWSSYYNNSWSYSPWNYSPWSYSGFNNYWGWNSYYNPYYPQIIVVNPKQNPSLYNRVKTFNSGAYSNRTYNNSNNNINRKSSSYRPLSNSRYNNTNSNSSMSTPKTNNPSLGSSIRKVFRNDNDNGSYSRPQSNDRPTRTYSPPPSDNNSSRNSPSSSSSSSGGSRSSSSSGGGVSRPGRN